MYFLAGEGLAKGQTPPGEYPVRDSTPSRCNYLQFELKFLSELLIINAMITDNEGKIGEKLWLSTSTVFPFEVFHLLLISQEVFVVKFLEFCAFQF